MSRLAAAGVAAVVLAAGLASGQGAMAATAHRVCSQVDVPVSLGDGEPVTAHVSGQLCRPSSRQPRSVQLLVHGATYDHVYWDFPYANAAYSYVDQAVKAGYATFNIDEVGVGGSTHPASSALTSSVVVSTLHQVVQALRSGAAGGTPFLRVEYVGHSFGSVFGVVEAATYQDVDALLLTGYSHMDSSSWAAEVKAGQHPANTEQKWANLDAGYLTSMPGTRGASFYDEDASRPGGADPGVIAMDERTKDVFSVGELQTRPNTAGLTPQIHVPVFIVDGQEDNNHCAPDASDCSSTGAFLQQEKPYFSPDAHLRALLVPNTGHDVNLHRSAPTISYPAEIAWSLRFIKPNGALKG